MKKQEKKIYPCCWNCDNGFEAICGTKHATEMFRASKRMCCASRPVSKTAQDPFKKRTCSQFEPHTFGPWYKRNIDGEEAAVLQHLTPSELKDYWAHQDDRAEMDLNATFPLEETAAGRMTLGRMLLSLESPACGVLSFDTEGNQIALMNHQAAMIYAIEHGVMDDGKKSEETVFAVVLGKAERAGIRPVQVECYLSITNNDVAEANKKYAKRVGQSILINDILSYGISPSMRTFCLPHQKFKCEKPKILKEHVFNGIFGLQYTGQMSKES